MFKIIKRKQKKIKCKIKEVILKNFKQDIKLQKIIDYKDNKILCIQLVNQLLKEYNKSL